MTLPSGEPAAGPWRVVPSTEFGRLVLAAAGHQRGRPSVVAVDGRGASGKSTLAELLATTVPNSALVHTDDIAWHHSFFDWADLVADNVLTPARRGAAVSYRPPGWVSRDRPGAVEVAADRELLVLEGVGAGRRELTPVLDAIVWVQSDFEEAERRGIARDIAHGENGGPDETVEFWHRWMAEELVFLDAQRPWERAELFVAGSSALPCPPGHVVLAQTLAV